MPSDKGCLHNFAISCIIQNTINIFRSFHMRDLGTTERADDSEEKEKYSFQLYCYDSADQLFELADTLVELL